MTDYALLVQPNPYYAQGQYPRRGGVLPSGTMVIHDAENLSDFIPPDLSAESLLNYLRTRRTPGCYHTLADSDSRIPAYPFQYETWHCVNTNRWSIGHSMAGRVADWPLMSPAFRLALMTNCALNVADAIRWTKAERGIIVPIKWITREQAMNRHPGLITHGKTRQSGYVGTIYEGTDPARRSDPFSIHFPHDEFLSLVADAVGGIATPTPQPTPPARSVATLLPLAVDGVEGPLTITVEEWVLRNTGDYRGIIEWLHYRTPVRGDYLESAEQRFLARQRDGKGVPYYRGAIDGDFGPMSITAEQRWLRDRGFYLNAAGGPGYVEAEHGQTPDRGKLTIMGLQRAINAGAIR